ncbi:MAG: ABC transporter ATP-binding protein/permease [Acholeplasmatales bacterium]|jgi:ATP-binding cassette subfamily B protein|nr:ABC transporter ATP-binding protein/permease [Acholeplasmatales bacterium]
MRDFVENSKNKTDLSLIKRIFSFLKGNKKKLIIAIAFTLLLVGINLLPPLILAYTVGLTASTEYSFNQKVIFIIIMILVYALVIVIAHLTVYKQNMILQIMGQDIVFDLRAKIFSHIEILGIGQFNTVPVGKLMTRVCNDSNAIAEMYSTVAVQLVSNFLTLLATFVLLLVLSWKLTLLVIATIPLAIAATFLFRYCVKNNFRQMRNNVSEINAFLSENLHGMKVTQIFHQEQKQIEAFKKTNKAIKRNWNIQILCFAIYRPVIYAITMSGVLLAIYFGANIAWVAISGVMLIAYQQYIRRFYDPLEQLSEQFNTIQDSFSSAEKIFDVLDTEPEIFDSEECIELQEFNGNIEFRNVWFYYNKDEWVLKDVSFTISKGETVAFVGSTGSGKSTILNLIVRNYDVIKGEIFLDGISIKKLKIESIRRQIGQMLQDVFLFTGTIYDNITLKDKNISKSKVIESSKYVGADTFIDILPDKYDTLVIERGANFSTGQRQLLSFARALCYNPSLMILDEATASIDAESEELIQESLKKMSKISTMIIVAHRISTIQHSDKIFVIKKGEIIERGNHQELLKLGGTYYNLYMLQYEEKKNS